jgi:alpha-D-ribose 1-methylphosphonate 5-triphosphate synthase subunit PhnH
MQVHTPVVPTQSVYRQLLQAMSHPGRLYTLPLREWSCPLLAVCETLLDHEVSFCVLPGADASWEADIFALTKARVAALHEADYLVIPGSSSDGAITEANLGDLAFPDRGATFMYVMDGPLPESTGTGPMLSGPGLARESHPDVNPLDAEEWRQLKALNDDYPLGVDALCLIGETQVLAIPRSTRIKVD